MQLTIPNEFVKSYPFYLLDGSYSKRIVCVYVHMCVVVARVVARVVCVPVVVFMDVR